MLEAVRSRSMCIFQINFILLYIAGMSSRMNSMASSSADTGAGGMSSTQGELINA